MYISLVRSLNMDLSIFFTLFFIVSSNAEDIQLNTANGPLLGQTGYTLRHNLLWYMFQGIPYAEPPTRFELAKEKKPWAEVINCTYDKRQCVQGSSPVLGSEDCLTLSVYSPNITGNYPVLVWVHGGYYTVGNASYASIPPDLIVEEGVVFVAIQYRLGIFGFMSTGDLACPGNLGLKDQVIALQWVQKNIAYFGGDPKRVTLGGQSTGAASVALHLQSPKSQGLFHALILNSGSSFNLWSYNRRAKETAVAVGLHLGVDTTSSQTLVNGLKSAEYQELQKASVTEASLIFLENPLAGLLYGYVQEPEYEDAFFTGKSEQIMSEGNFAKVPSLMGFTSNEAIFFGNISLLIRAYLLTYNLNYTRLVPADLTRNSWNNFLAGLAIKSHFFGINLLGLNAANFVQFASSDQFERPIWQFGLDVSKYVNATYFYQFSYEGPLGGITYRTYNGAGHSEDLNYLFYKLTENTSPADLLTRDRLVRLWCNFVKERNPTSVEDDLLQNKTWLPIRNGNVEGTYYYFNINSTLDTLTNPKDKDIQFWNHPTRGIYPKYGQRVYDTY